MRLDINTARASRSYRLPVADSVFELADGVALVSMINRRKPSRAVDRLGLIAGWIPDFADEVVIAPQARKVPEKDHGLGVAESQDWMLILVVEEFESEIELMTAVRRPELK